MDDTPLVSVCIPTFNRADMIARAVQSAIDQTYRNIEIIVVDNASTDRTRDVISSFTDPRVTYVRNEKNLGLFGNFNRCIEIAHGEFIHILHSDDSIEPDFIRACTDFFRQHRNVWLTFTGIILERENRMLARPSLGQDDIIFEAPGGFQKLLSVRGFIPCPTVMARRDLYEKTGGFSLEYPYSSDFYTYLGVARRFDIAYVHGVHVHYSQGEHSESYRLLFASPLGYLDTLKIYLRLEQDLGIGKNTFRSELDLAYKRYIGDCFFAGFTRSGAMANTRPALFTGLAFSGWSMMSWAPLKGLLQKAAWFFIIVLAGTCLAIPPVRVLIGWLLEKKSSAY